LQTNFAKYLRKRIIKNYLDVLALKELEKESLISSYDFMLSIHKKFAILVSPGTAYTAIYSLERKGLIEGTKNSRKTVYILTDEGEKALRDIAKAKRELEQLVAMVF
jgi:DNA-binding PadR family transcriptional regulator